MAENMGKWPSGHGQLPKIWLSEGDGGKTVTPAAQFGYDCHGFEDYLGNVGSGVFLQKGDPERTLLTPDDAAAVLWSIVQVQ